MMALTAHTNCQFFSHMHFKQNTLAASILLAAQSGIREREEDRYSRLKHANPGSLHLPAA